LTLRDQLSSLTVSDLTGAQITDAGGKVFLSPNAVANQQTIEAIASTWRAVHAPSYGVAIPGSQKSTNGDATTATILTPPTNSTLYINALSVSNTNNTDPATITLQIGGGKIFSQEVVPNAEVIVVGFGGIDPFLLADGATLDISSTGAPVAAEITWTLAYATSIQG